MKKLVWVASTVALLALGGCVVDPTYTFCTSGDECEVLEQCFVVRTFDPVDDSPVSAGAFCSEECSDDLQCERNLGFPGSCMDADGLGGICFQECDLPGDCFGTSECFNYTDSTDFTNRVCLPQTL